MNLNDYNWLIAENLPPGLKHAFQDHKSIQSVVDLNLGGATDSDLLRHASKNNQIIITQDSDFGKLIYTEQIPFIGIVYLRPGNLNVQRQIETLEFLLESVHEVVPPFIIVATQSDGLIKVRIRNSLTLL